MSYLNALRLHFAGTFQASVSTVNNTSAYFDNTQFQPAYQLMQDGAQPNGLWNPTGDAAWRLIGCEVTSAFMPDGTAVAKTDRVGTCLVADSDGRVSAKLADLDPDNQGVSMIFGLQVRITDQGGTTLLRGNFDPAAFMDLWNRAPLKPQLTNFGAWYQSVLTDLEWGDVSGSPFLTALKHHAQDGLLSIKFNVDLYEPNFTSPNFTRGRVVGTIGPATKDEPRHFVLGRQLLQNMTPDGLSAINYCVARVDEARGKVLLDLGNALPTDGDVLDQGLLTLQCGSVRLGTLDPKLYAAKAEAHKLSWYQATAGVVEFPVDRVLHAHELEVLRTNPMVLSGPGPTAPVDVPNIGSSVNTGEVTGQHVRADQFVFRMNPGTGETDNVVHVKLYATKFGRPLAGQAVSVSVVPITFGPASLTPPTDANGLTTLTITASDPGFGIRGYVDGMVYSLTASLPGGALPPENPSETISLLIWSGFQPDVPVSWWGNNDPNNPNQTPFPGIQSVFQQYENLYPVMKRFMKLGDYEQVKENAGLLAMVFALDPSNPNSMPVTRDLSEAKRKAIYAWLTTPGSDHKTPLLPLGTPPPASAPTAAVAAVAPARGGHDKPAIVARLAAASLAAAQRRAR
jgi:hypothetical protein